MSNVKYKLDHITQENGKWFAEVRVYSGNDISKREHTGNLWGWDGMTYKSLQCMLSEYYNITIPKISELNLIKKTSCRKIYSVV